MFSKTLPTYYFMTKQGEPIPRMFAVQLNGSNLKRLFLPLPIQTAPSNLSEQIVAAPPVALTTHPQQ